MSHTEKRKAYLSIKELHHGLSDSGGHIMGLLETPKQQAADRSPTGDNGPSGLFGRLALPVMCLLSSLAGFGIDRGFRAIGEHAEANLARRVANAFDNSISLDELKSTLTVLSRASLRLETDRITQATYIEYSADEIRKQFGTQNTSANQLVEELTRLSEALSAHYRPHEDYKVNQPAQAALRHLEKLLPVEPL
jgi:hypothetical protein